MTLNIIVEASDQTLTLFRDNKEWARYRISTAKNGMGEVMHSEMTPRGKHIIRAKIGANAAPNTVFVERRPTGEVFNLSMRQQFPDRDWILTRILWLSGTEKGRNRGGQVDTMRRFVYIHGSPDDVCMGKPGSRGCVRMWNRDIIDLFERVPAGTPVDIRE